MRIVLNVESLTPPLTGIGVYTRELLAGLSVHPRIRKLTCFANGLFVEPGRESSAPFTRSRLKHLVRSLPGSYAAVRLIREQTFRWRLRKHGGSLYHEPNYILRPFNGRTLVTVHDLSFLHYPEFHPVQRVRQLERHLPKSLERADHIVTDSHFVRRELIELLGIEPERVTAVHLGVAEDFRPHPPAETAPVLGRLALRHGRYLLAVATLEPRKNLERLLQAFLLLPADLRRDFPLVLGGRVGWKSSALCREVALLERDGSVIAPGYVPSTDLPYLYAGAAAFAFPSLYEGFGLPPLEALASGVPVLISDRASLPEVTGDQAIAVDPLDVRGMADALTTLLTDREWRERVAIEGPRHSARFNWSRTVDETVSIYAALAQ